MSGMNQRSQLSQRIRNMLWVVLLSIVLSVGLGGYWFVEVIDQLGEHVRTETVALLELEEVVSDANFAFTRQAREWKESLLFRQDAALYNSHHQAMQFEVVALQQKLQQARVLMEAQHLDVSSILAIEKREQTLLAAYADAQAQIDSKNPQYYSLAHEQVRDKARAVRDEFVGLQHRLRENVKANVFVLGEGRSISNTFLQIGLLAVLLPLVALFAFYRAYRALREIGRNDARARAIYESIGDAVLVADAEGRADTLNEVAQQLTGWSQADAHGRSLSDVFQLVDDGTQQRVASPAEGVLRDGCVIALSGGMLLRRRDGSEVAVEVSASPVRDEKGRLSGAVMVFHDVTQHYAMMRELQDERELFRQTFGQAAVGMAQLGMDGKWSRVNQKLCEMTGYNEAELLELSFQGVTYPDDLGRDVEAMKNLLVSHTRVYQTEKRYVRKDGSIFWVGLTVYFVWKPDGTPDYGVSIIQDIEARKEAEQIAASSQEQYQALFEQMPGGVLLVDEQARIIAHNHEALRQLEYDSAALLALHVWDFETVDDPPAIEQRYQKIRLSGRDDFESRYRTRSGRLMDVDVSVQLVHLADGRNVFQTLFRDITAQKQAEQQIEHLAYHDQLTGLANRRLLQDRIEQAISSALRRNSEIAVCYLDLDHFKDVNDSLGHEAGDMLLQMVSGRLLKCIRDEDTLARIGGDEFVIMLNNITNSGDAAVIAQKIIHEVSQPYPIGNEELRVTPSIGISICPQDGRDSDSLLKHADAAMYQSKQSGRMTYRFYTEVLHEKAMERMKIERLLHKAIAKNEFEMYYQPQVDLSGQKIVGCEALIRWNHPGMGQVSPAEFIPVAEHSNLIIEIGAWVMREVCRQARVWQDQGFKLKVSFNVSARQFMRPEELLTVLRSAISESGVDPAMMVLELTESLLLDSQGMSDVLNRISEMGLTLALDDFGTGYSSLSYLRRFPIHILKIDKSFVGDADRDPDDTEMVKTIIGMAHNLRMNLVAEGVETVAQAQLLTAEGCEVAQGYYFSRPLPVGSFNELLQAADQQLSG